MTREEAMKRLKEARFTVQPYQYINEALDTAIKALEQESCEMTAEEYRQRMIQAFHNADCDELIAICVLPIEKEFEHLEWLLKSNYKKEPCDDCISRQAVLDKAVYTETEEGWSGMTVDVKDIEALPPVNPQKTGYWIIEKWNNKEHYSCSRCQHVVDYESCYHYCPYCGSKMVEPQESEE